MKRERIPINVRNFFLRDSSDEVCVFAGLKKFLRVHKFLSLLLNEFLQPEIRNHVQFKILLTSLDGFVCL